MRRTTLASAAVGALALIAFVAALPPAHVAQPAVAVVVNDGCDLAGVIPDCKAVMAKLAQQRPMDHAAMVHITKATPMPTPTLGIMDQPIPGVRRDRNGNWTFPMTSAERHQAAEYNRDMRDTE